MIFIPAHVHTVVEVGTGVSAGSYRPGRKLPFRMKGNVPSAGRKNYLVVLVCMNRYIGETKDCVHHGRAVQNSQGNFQIRLARPECITHGPSHLTHPYGFTAVLVLLELILNGDKRSSPMVVRDVPLDAAGNPRADKADQRRLYDVLAIKEIVAVGFIDAFEDAAAYLRQNADPDVLVFEINHFVGLILFVAG